MPLYPNGTSSTIGGRFVTAAPLLTSGFIRFVHFGTGLDTNGGLVRARPMKTLAAAVAASSSADLIVLLEGHDEVVTAAVTPVGKDVFIFGEGYAEDGGPSVILRPAAGVSLIDGNGRFVCIANVRFLSPSASTAVDGVTNAGHLVIDGCRFEADENLQAAWVSTSALTARIDIRETTFVATGTSPTVFPLTFITVADAIPVFRMENVTLDGGVYGTGTLAGAGTVLNFTASSPNVQITGLRLLGPADVYLLNSTGYLQLSEGPEGQVNWVAASLKLFPGGIGGTGHALVSGQNLWTTANVRFVDPVSGNNNSSGLSRDVPLLTIAQALANGVDGDIVVLVGAGHADNVALSKRTILVGDAIDGEGQPAWGISASGANPGITCSLDGSALLNLRMEHSGTSNAVVINTLIDDIMIDHCLFTLSGNGSGGVLLGGVTALRPVVRSSTFLLVGSADTSGPSFAIDDNSGHGEIWLEDLLFESTGEGVDGGVTTSLALSLFSAAALTVLAAFGLEFRRCRARIIANINGVVNASASGGGAVDWA